MKTKSSFLCFAVIVLVMGYSSFVCAGTVSGVLGGVWDGGWIQFQINDNVSHGGPREDWVDGNKAYPGSGGQAFDAEYLFYKLDGNTLSLGLQTGFDIEDGEYRTGGRDYWAGDMALSFDGSINYSHAVDFGLLTKDYGQHLVGADRRNHTGAYSGDGIDDAGLYSVTDWNNHVIRRHSSSNPFAMGGGDLVDAGGTNYDFISHNDTLGNPVHNVFSGTSNGETSYFRQVSFDISNFRQSDGSLSVNAHWTMSCGNDAINGSFHQPVPEPGTIALLGIGLAGLVGVEKRRRRKKRAVDNS